MKYIFILLISIITILHVIAKPKKLKPSNNNSQIDWKIPNTSIYGYWDWAETRCCGKKQGVVTKKTAATENRFYINADNTFKEIATNNKLNNHFGTINLYKIDNIKMVQFNDERPAQYYISDNNDTLILSWQYLEQQTEVYIRLK